MSFPSFATGEVLTAADMNAVGLWLVKSQTVGTGVSTVTVTDAFSADYDNYRILIRGIKSSTATNLFINFGATTTGYYGSFYYDAYTGSNTGTARRNNGADLYIGDVETSLSEQFSSVEVANPFLSLSTTLHGTYYGGTVSGWFGGTQASTTSFTSFRLKPNSGTFTGGTINVYGYKK
jgi:hypothetical protein